MNQTPQEQIEQGRMMAVEGLAATYAILQSQTVRDYAARHLNHRRAQELEKACNLNLTDSERRDALIRWHLLNDLLAGPKKDLISYHQALGTRPEIMLDLDDSGTDSRA